MTKQTITIPDIGGATDVDVIEICVAVGDQINKEDALIVLESEKASMEIPAPQAGKVLSISVKEGDKVAEGDAILELDSAESSDAATTPTEQAPATEPEQPSPTAEPEPPTVSTAAPATTTPVAEQVTVRVPDIGGAEGVDVIEVCVAVGDTIDVDASLIVLESEKASMEIPAPQAGTVLSIAVKEGDKVSEGDAILELQPTASAASAEQTTAPPPSTPTPTKTTSPSVQPGKPPVEQAMTQDANVYAGPAVRQLARELGVDLAQVTGTGQKGRVTKEDLQSFVKQSLSGAGKSSAAAAIEPVPAVDFAAFGEIHSEPLSKLNQITATNMQRNWLNIPHVTLFDAADVSDLEVFRQTLKAEGEVRQVKITLMPFLLKACAVALREHPMFNASLSADGQQRVYKHYIHIGVAVDTPAGLLVPVIRDVDQKSIWQLAEEVVQYAQKAKDKKLTPTDMQGGCFTVSSLGRDGGQGFTPIINAPEVGILGVSNLTVQPQWDGATFQPRKMLPLSLSFDHRAINGAEGGRFLSTILRLLTDSRRMLL